MSRGIRRHRCRALGRVGLLAVAVAVAGCEPAAWVLVMDPTDGLRLGRETDPDPASGTPPCAVLLDRFTLVTRGRALEDGTRTLVGTSWDPETPDADDPLGTWAADPLSGAVVEPTSPALPVGLGRYTALWWVPGPPVTAVDDLVPGDDGLTAARLTEAGASLRVSGAVSCEGPLVSFDWVLPGPPPLRCPREDLIPGPSRTLALRLVLDDRPLFATDPTDPDSGVDLAVLAASDGADGTPPDGRLTLAELEAVPLTSLGTPVRGPDGSPDDTLADRVRAGARRVATSPPLGCHTADAPSGGVPEAVWDPPPDPTTATGRLRGDTVVPVTPEPP